MAGEYDINLSNGSVLTTLYPLETSGPDNMSTPRHILHALPKFGVLSAGENGSTINTVVVIKGDKTHLFVPGEAFRLIGTTGVSSTTVFTVSSDVVPNTTSPGSYYDVADDVTMIYVGPSTNFGTVPSNGQVELDAFVLAGDLTYRFINGFEFTISESGGNNGVYTVNYSRVAGNDTVIHVNQPIPGSTHPLGQVQYEIGDNPAASADLRTTLKLPGKGTLNYGEMVVENLVRMTENWAGDVPPDDITSPITGSGTVGQALIGQYWYNTTPNREGFKYYNGSEWSNDWDIDDGALIFRDAEDADKDIIITASENSIDHPNWTTPSANDQPGLVVWSAEQKPDGGSIFRVLDQGANERLDVEYHSDPTLGYIRTINNLKVEGTGDTLIWSDRVAIGAGKQPTFDTTTLTIQGDGISINSDVGVNSVISMNSPLDRESVITLEHNSITNGHIRETNDSLKIIEIATFNTYDLNLISSDNLALYSTTDTSISANNQLSAIARDGRVTIEAIDAGTGAANAGNVQIISDNNFDTTVGGNYTETITGTSDTTITGDTSTTITGNTTYSVTGTHDTTITGDTTYTMSGTNYTETISATNITSNMTGTVTNTVTGDYSETFNGTFTSTTNGTSDTTVNGETTYTVTNGDYTATFDQVANYNYNDTYNETVVGDYNSSAANYYFEGNSFNYTGIANGSPVTADFNVNVEGAINLDAQQGMTTNVASYTITTEGDIVFDSTNGDIKNFAFNGEYSVTSDTYNITTNQYTAQVNGNSTTNVTGNDTHNVGSYDLNSTTNVDMSGTVYNADFSDTYNVDATNAINNNTTTYNVTASDTVNITGDNAINLNTTSGSPAGSVTVNSNYFVSNATSNTFEGTSQFNSDVNVDGDIITTQHFYGPPGSESDPTFGFTDYPGTGMYYDTTNNTLVFSVGGTSIFYLDPADDTLSVDVPNYEDGVTDPNDIPNKAYVDNAIYDYVNSRSWREPVDVKSPDSYLNSSQFPTTGTIDDVAIYPGMRVLFSDVDNVIDADIWVFDGAAWNTVPENPKTVGDAVYVKHGSSKSNAFAWNDEDEWAQITGSGGGTFFMYEQHIATPGQTIFDLNNTYKRMADGSRMMVYVDGIKYIPFVGYQETSPSKITMQPPAPFLGGETVEFYALYETTANARLKHEVLTGYVGNTLINFALLSYVPNSDNLLVYLNGQKVISGVDFTEVSTNSIDWIGVPLEAADVIEAYAGVPILAGTDLESIENVSSVTPSEGQVLTYNATEAWWEARPPVVPALGDLTNVNTAGASNGYVLTYNGSIWAPAIPGGTDDGVAYDELIGNGGAVYNTTNVTVTAKSGGKAFQQVFVNGILQMEGRNYTVTGANQITFVTGAEPAINDDIAIFKL